MITQSFYPRSMQAVPEGRTTFKNPGMPWHLQLTRTDSNIRVDSFYPSDDMQVTGDANAVRVDRQGLHLDTVFSKSGQNISVNRSGVHEDLNILRDETTVKLDRPGRHNDLTATFGENRIDIRGGDFSQRLTLTKVGDEVRVSQPGVMVETFPASLFAGGWPDGPSLLAISEYIGMPEHQADALDRWAESGIDKDDLIRVDRQGQVHTFDHEFR